MSDTTEQTASGGALNPLASPEALATGVVVAIPSLDLVRSEPTPRRYVLRRGVMRDKLLGIEWQRHVEPKVVTFEAACAYAKGLGLAGGGWHLPTVRELISIVDYAKSYPCIDQKMFGHTPPMGFWTAQAVADVPGQVWCVGFSSGMVLPCRIDDIRMYVRCVRSVDRSADRHRSIPRVRRAVELPPPVVARTEGGEECPF